MRSLTLLTVLVACGGTPTPSPSEPGAATQPAAAASGHDHHAEAGHDHHAKGGHGEHGAHAAAGGTVDGDWVVFGDAFGEGEVVELGALLAKADAHTGQDVRVQGRVSEVCQKAGCWMVVSEGEQHVRVRMKDHSFAVDKAGAGRTGQVRGTLIARAVDPEEVAHFASETREGGVVPEQGAEGTVYEIEATSVRLASAR